MPDKDLQVIIDNAPLFTGDATEWSAKLDEYFEAHGVAVYLKSFVPEGFIEGEKPEQAITIIPSVP